MESLEGWLAAHGAALLRLAFMLTGSADSAQDLMQDTLVKLHRHWAKVSRADAPLAYAKRVMVNEYTRGAKRRWNTAQVLVQDPASFETPRSGAFETELVERDRLWLLIGQLPNAERAAVVLRFYEDLSDRQAAELLGCRPSTVRANASRALARLRQQMPKGEQVTP
ncbi:MAG: sigma-70 family RNA polymerase sigma factor [Actinomycetia bacterium]|nr:sigma-70 family RNA polymerase sigma factor [Actinomycetes bacterium]